MSLTLVMGFTVLAQTSPGDTGGSSGAAATSQPATTGNDTNDWGWLGLIGLVGLVGLLRRRHAPTVTNRVPTSSTMHNP